MNEKILKNPLALAGLLLLISAVLGAILYFMSGLLNVKYTSLISPIIAAMTVGQIYAYKFKEVMDKKLRLKVSSIYIGIQFVLGFLLGLFLGTELKILLISLTIISIIFFFIIYYILARWGRLVLKPSKDKKK